MKSFGWYEDTEAVYIAMEYCPLGDLQSYLSRRSPLPSTEAQELICQLLEGLHEMHDNGFAHRDLKPAVCTSCFYGAKWELLINLVLIECPHQIAATGVLVGETR